MDKDLLKPIVEKFMSGRYCLTVISGLVFAYAVWRRLLPPEATSAIITMVFVSYFERHDRTNGGGKNV